MKAYACFAVLIGSIALTMAPVAAQIAPLPVESFGSLPAVSDAAISPDGSKVAMALAQESGSVLSVFDISQQRRIFIAAVPDKTQLRGVGWIDDTHVRFLLGRTFHPGEVLPSYMHFVGTPHRVDYYRSGVLDLATSDMKLLTTNEDEPWQDTGSSLIGPIEGDPGFVRMVGRVRGGDSRRPALYRVSFSGNVIRPLPTSGANDDTVQYVLNESGSVVARVDAREETNHWRVFAYDHNAPRLLLEGQSATGAPVDIEGLMPDGRLALLDDDDGAAEFYKLYGLNPADGRRELLFEREGEIDDVIVDPWTRRVVGVEWIEDDVKEHFFDAALQAAYEFMVQEFAGGGVSLVSWSRDRSKILVFGERGVDGGGYYVYTPATNTLTHPILRYPDMASAALERQSITYRARGGVRVPAYLTGQLGAQNRNMPLVLLVHGGPHSRDTIAFDWWAAFLASRGYLVLQPNFRGSSGYGRSWAEQGRRQWGGLMQTDAEDGVAALIRAGMVDSARVCIVGASYGGYAALAGATLTPDRYKCAVSVAGLSDLPEFLRQREAVTGHESISSDYWRMSIGDRQEDRQHLRDVSPATLAERVRIPILLIHGTDDTVVPITQSRQMRDRLRAAGKDVRFVELTGDDHWLSDRATRIQMLREIDDFLGRNIGAHP